MMFRTHLAIGIISALLIHDYFNTGLLFSIVLILSTSLPDIDHQGSWIGRRLWIFSKPINILFGHRGITHSMFVPLGIFGIIYYYGHQAIGLAIMLGYITHILADSFTNEGVKIAYPVSKKAFSGPLKTNGVGEHVLFTLLIIGIGFKLIQSLIYYF